jgi:hypothetical protein
VSYGLRNYEKRFSPSDLRLLGKGAHRLRRCALTPDTFTGDCDSKWKNLKPLIKPTQDEVGYAWVQRKYDKNFQSSNDAQEEIDSSPIPAVLGPTDDGSGTIYIVDHHHELAALDWSGYTDVSVSTPC